MSLPHVVEYQLLLGTNRVGGWVSLSKYNLPVNEHWVQPLTTDPPPPPPPLQGHMRIEKCTQRSRQSVFWPFINSDIKDMVSSCTTCLTHRNRQQQETLIPHKIPSRPWTKVATDLFTLYGKDYTVLVIDYYSKYVEVEYLKDTSSSTVIKKLKKIFSRHGIPQKLCSDNGPEFKSKEFQRFAMQWDIKHKTSSWVAIVLGGNRPGWQSPWVAIALGGNRPGWQSPWVAIALGGNRPGWQSPWVAIALGGNRPGWQSSWVAIVLGGNRPGWQSSWVAIVLGGNRPGWQSS